MQAAELLLQERAPRDVAVARPRAEEVQAAAARARPRRARSPRRFTLAARSGAAHAPALERALRGDADGRRLGLQPLARPRGHPLARGRHARRLGQYVFLRDVAQRRRSGRRATSRRGVEPDSYEAVVRRGPRRDPPARRRDRDARSRSSSRPRTTPRCAASRSRTSARAAREIELTSYAEVVLAPPAADAAHPGVLEAVRRRPRSCPSSSALLATRRPRSPEEPPVWAAHVVGGRGRDASAASQYETDRARFLGRGRGIRTPMSVIDGRPLSNTVGRGARSDLQPAARACGSRPAPARGSRSRRWSRRRARRVARPRRQVPRSGDLRARGRRSPGRRRRSQLRHLGIEPDEAHLFQRLANRILYADPALRAVARRAARATPAAQSALWAHGISGDLPIVLVRIDDAERPGDRPPAPARARVLAAEAARRRSRDPERAGRVLRAGPPGRARGAGPDEPVDARARRPTDRAAASSSCAAIGSRPPSATAAADRGARRAAEPPRARSPSRSRAWSAPDGRAGAATPRRRRRARRRRAAAAARSSSSATASAASPPTAGSTSPSSARGSGRRRRGSTSSPTRASASWSPSRGSGYTWAVNSRENQLTPWSNDPVARSARRGHLRARRGDAASSGGRRRSRSARSTRPTSCATARATAASSTPRTASRSTCCSSCPLDDPVKISRLVIENRSGRARRLSVTAYVEWVLGASRSAAAPHVVTEHRRGDRRAARAQPVERRVRGPRRVRRPRRAGRRRGPATGRSSSAATARSTSPPALERGAALSGTVGAGLDPCARAPDDARAAPRRARRRSSSCSGEAATRRRGARARRRATATADLDARAARGRRALGRRPRRACRCRRRTARSTCC